MTDDEAEGQETEKETKANANALAARLLDKLCPRCSKNEWTVKGDIAVCRNCGRFLPAGLK